VCRVHNPRFTMKAGHIHSGVETDDVSDCTSPLVGMSSLPPRRTTLIGSFASGALATSCSAILTNPMEVRSGPANVQNWPKAPKFRLRPCVQVAKTRLQLSGELNRVSSAQYKGVFDGTGFVTGAISVAHLTETPDFL
jgi:hypothetical protein